MPTEGRGMFRIKLRFQGPHCTEKTENSQMLSKHGENMEFLYAQVVNYLILKMNDKLCCEISNFISETVKGSFAHETVGDH